MKRRDKIRCQRNSDDDIHQPTWHNDVLAHRFAFQRGTHGLAGQRFLLRLFVADARGNQCAVAQFFFDLATLAVYKSPMLVPKKIGAYFL